MALAPAVRTGAEDLQGVADIGEAVLVGHLVGPALNGGSGDLDRVPAVPADQVVMVHDTGRSVAITDRGRRIAIIQPVRTDVFAEMVDGGLIAAGDGQLATVTRARSTRSVAEILAEINRDST